MAIRHDVLRLIAKDKLHQSTKPVTPGLQNIDNNDRSLSHFIPDARLNKVTY